MPRHDTATLRSLQHVAAICDTTPSSSNAAWRAALVARDLGLPLLLLQPRPREDALTHAGAAAALRERFREQLGVATSVVRSDGDALAQLVSITRQGLLVLPSQRGGPLLGRIFGTDADRVIRLARGPVLVVKQAARASYRRVLTACDLQGRSELLLGAGAALARRAQVAVVHALPTAPELALQEIDAAPGVVREHRLRRAARARAAIDTLAATHAASQAHAEVQPEVLPVVVFGSPARMIVSSAQAARSDLVVIGKRRRGLLADFFLGGVTRRVLADAQCDVLVVPLAAGVASAGAGQPRVAAA